MLWPYGVAGEARSAPARLDRWLPAGARRLEHHVIDVGAEPRAALAAIRGVRLQEMPIVGALLAIRGLPFPFGGETTLDQFFGTSPFLILEEEPGRELVFGVVGPFWRWRRGRVPPRVPRTPEDFRAALREGHMAAVANFRVEPGARGSRLWTETWVTTPRASQAVAFTAYWLLVGPFSAWIRRLFLRAGRQKAEAGGAEGRGVRPV